MDIRQISLYLSGKLPPFYGESRKLVFIRALRNFSKEYTNDEINFIDQQSKGEEERFYAMIMEDILNISEVNLEKFIKKLKLPSDIDPFSKKGGFSGNYSWNDFLQKAKESGINEGDKDIGKFFEDFCRDLFEMAGFANVISSSKGTDGGIDLYADWLLPFGDAINPEFSFIAQCKYKTSGNVSVDEINELIKPFISDTGCHYQGAFFFTNSKFQANALAEIKKLSQGRLNIIGIPIDGKKILDFINKNEALYKKYLPKIKD